MSELATVDRLDDWQDLIRESFVALDIVADRRAPFSGHVRQTELGHLHVATVESGPQEFTRTSRLALAGDRVCLQVGVMARGTGIVHQDGREAVLMPGDYALYESDRPFRWRMEQDWELLVLTWPRASVRIPDTVSRTLTAHCLSGRVGLGAIVGRMLRDLVGAPPQLSPAGCTRLGDEVLELVTTVAEEEVRPAEPERASDDLLRRIDSYITEHVSDVSLAPPEIAAAHFISTRHLHRLFVSRGITVSQQILRLRLERARLELRQPGSRSSITDISRRWGFSDLATFSRAFRTAYGTTPTRHRSAGAG